MLKAKIFFFTWCVLSCPLEVVTRRAYYQHTLRKINDCARNLTGRSIPPPDRHPEQILKVLIRKVDKSRPVEPSIYADLEPDRFQVFTTPEEITLPAMPA
eukprot:2988567-Amphidinium_carterae.1